MLNFIVTQDAIARSQNQSGVQLEINIREPVYQGKSRSNDETKGTRIVCFLFSLNNQVNIFLN